MEPETYVSVTPFFDLILVKVRQKIVNGLYWSGCHGSTRLRGADRLPIDARRFRTLPLLSRPLFSCLLLFFVPRILTGPARLHSQQDSRYLLLFKFQLVAIPSPERAQPDEE